MRSQDVMFHHARCKNSYTYAPIRFIIFAFSLQLNGFGCTKSVQISTFSEAQNLQCSTGFMQCNVKRESGRGGEERVDVNMTS